MAWTTGTSWSSTHPILGLLGAGVGERGSRLHEAKAGGVWLLRRCRRHWISCSWRIIGSAACVVRRGDWGCQLWLSSSPSGPVGG